MDWLNAMRNINDENNISMIQITKIIANSITLRNTLQKLHNTIIDHIITKDDYVIIKARKDFYDKYADTSTPVPRESCINHLIRAIKKLPPPFLNEYRSLESDPSRILGDLILDIRMIYGYSYRPYRESIKDSKISKTSSSSAVDFGGGGGGGERGRKESDVNIPISARMSTARSQMYTSKVAPINKDKDINRDSSKNCHGSNGNGNNGSGESTIVRHENRISLHPASEYMKDSIRKQP